MSVETDGRQQELPLGFGRVPANRPNGQGQAGSTAYRLIAAILRSSGWPVNRTPPAVHRPQGSGALDFVGMPRERNGSTIRLSGVLLRVRSRLQTRHVQDTALQHTSAMRRALPTRAVATGPLEKGGIQ